MSLLLQIRTTLYQSNWFKLISYAYYTLMSMLLLFLVTTYYQNVKKIQILEEQRKQLEHQISNSFSNPRTSTSHYTFPASGRAFGIITFFGSRAGIESGEHYL